MSNHRQLLTLAGSLLCASALHAADAPPAEAAPAPAKADAAPAKAEPAPEPYQLKNRSSFSCAAGEGVRAPFWPVGWVHRKGVSSVVATAAAPKSALDEKAFRLTSVLLGSGGTGSLAVINGRAYSEGEFLKTPRGAVAAPAPGAPAPAAPPARIRVQRISDGSVVLQRAEETVTVSMQRQELAQKRVEEPLLDDER